MTLDQHGRLPKASTPYPDAICHDCGTKHGRLRLPDVSTRSMGTCGWCGRETVVTQPRDYGYPAYG